MEKGNKHSAHRHFDTRKRMSSSCQENLSCRIGDVTICSDSISTGPQRPWWIRWRRAKSITTTPYSAILCGMQRKNPSWFTAWSTAMRSPPCTLPVTKTAFMTAWTESSGPMPSANISMMNLRWLPTPLLS